MAFRSGISSVLWFLGWVVGRRQRAHRRLAPPACNDNALSAALIDGHDSNSRQRHVQTLREKAHERFVSAVVRWRRAEANFQRARVFAFDRIAARARLHLHAK